MTGVQTCALPIWNRVAPKTAVQNGIWQVGARIYAAAGGEEEEEWPANVTSVFPNPAKGIFYILMTDPERQYAIAKVYDQLGRFSFSQAVYDGLNQVNLPGSLPSGYYTITLEAANLERYVMKLILLN